MISFTFAINNITDWVLSPWRLLIVRKREEPGWNQLVSFVLSTHHFMNIKNFLKHKYSKAFICISRPTFSHCLFPRLSTLFENSATFIFGARAWLLGGRSFGKLFFCGESVVRSIFSTGIFRIQEFWRGIILSIEGSRIWKSIFKQNYFNAKINQYWFKCNLSEKVKEISNKTL